MATKDSDLDRVQNDVEFIRRVSRLVEKHVEKTMYPPAVLRPFCGQYVANLSVSEFIQRPLVKYPFASHESLLCAVIYVGRIVVHLGGFIHELAIHRLLGIALMVASKYNDDFFYNNSSWARVIGVSLKELNQLEVQFLALINFELHVTSEQYFAAAAYVLSHAELARLKQQTNHPTEVPSRLVCDLRPRPQTLPTILQHHRRLQSAPQLPTTTNQHLHLHDIELHPAELPTPPNPLPTQVSA